MDEQEEAALTISVGQGTVKNAIYYMLQVTLILK